MATMTHRATFALDEGTIKRIQKLASLWEVSQAEVVRRCIQQSASLTQKEKDPLSILKGFHASGGISLEEGEKRISSINQNRSNWRSDDLS